MEESWPSAPHKPVRLRMLAKAPEVLKRVQKTPKPLPLDRPMGCAPTPPPWPAIPEAATQEQVNVLWGQLVQCMEQRMLGYHDEVWSAEDPHTGRAEQPRWVVVRERRPPNRNRPTTSAAGLAWRWLQRTISAILALHGWVQGRPPAVPRKPVTPQQFVHGLGQPWILAGDFQMAPDELLQGPPAQCLRGRVVATTGPEGTCRQQGCQSTLDYYIVCE